VKLQAKLGVSLEQSWTTPSPAKLEIKLIAKLKVSLQWGWWKLRAKLRASAF